VAAPTFGAEGTDGHAPATKVRMDQGRDALAGDITSGACGVAGRASDEARRLQSRVAASRRRRGDPGHVAAADV
jgi:hypothetical protein